MVIFFTSWGFLCLSEASQASFNRLQTLQALPAALIVCSRGVDFLEDLAQAGRGHAGKQSGKSNRTRLPANLQQTKPTQKKVSTQLAKKSAEKPFRYGINLAHAP